MVGADIGIGAGQTVLGGQLVALGVEHGLEVDQAAGEALARQSKDVEPAAYRAVDPGLFHAIVAQDVPPSPGPQAGTPSPDIKPK